MGCQCHLGHDEGYCNGARTMMGEVPPCVQTYSVHQSVRDYARAIPKALKAVSDATGVTFVETADSPDISFSEAKYAGTAFGEYFPDSGNIVLYRMPGLDGQWRRSLVMHEVLHSLGIAHIPEPGYLMSTIVSGVTTMTEHDIEGAMCHAA